MNQKKLRSKDALRAFAVYAIPFAVVLVAGIVIYRNCIFAPYDYVFDYIGSDSVRQLYPSYWWLYETLFENSPSLWSLNMGLGTSVFSHSEIVINPLTYILYIGGKANIGHMFVWLIIFGMCLSSMSVNVWLGSFKLSGFARVVAASCYAVSGWLVVMGSNTPWITAYIYFPLLLKALDMLVLKGKKLPLVLASCAVALYSFYFLWMFAIAGLVYALMRMHWYKGFDGRRAILGVLLFLFGALLGAVWLLPSVDAVLQGSRLGTSPSFADLLVPDFLALLTGASRLVGVDALGSVASYSGSYDFFNLSTYASFIPLVAIPELLALSDSRLKRRTVAVVVLCVTSILFPVVSWVFNGFSDISYRWLFVWAPIVSLGTAMGLSIVFAESRWSWRPIVFTCVLLVLIGAVSCVALPVSGDDSLFGRVKRISFALLMVVLYAVLFRMFAFSKRKGCTHGKPFCLEKRRFANALVLFALSLLFVFESGVMYRNWPDSKSYSEQFSNMVENGTGFFDQDFDVVQGIRLSDDSFYRIEKAHGSVVVDQGVAYESDNDSMVQNYFGTHSYNSMNSSGAIDFLRAAGVFVVFPASDTSAFQSPYELDGPHLNYINGVGDRYRLMALLGVKYYITSDETDDLPSFFVLDDELSSDSRMVWRNKGAYPFASFYDKAISESEYMRMTDDEKDAALLSYAVLEDDSPHLGNMPRADVDDISDSDLLKNAALEHDIVKTEMINEGSYAIETNASSDGILLVTTPYEKNNWSITIDGVPAEPIRADCGLLGVAVDSGVHEVRVSYSPRWFGIGAVVSAVCLIGLLLCGALHCLLKMRRSNELGASR